MQQIEPGIIKITTIHDVETSWFRNECIIRSKAAGDSDSFRPLIPVESGHRFQSYPATFLGIPESDFIEVTLDNFKAISHHSPFKKRRTGWQERGYPCEK